MNWTQYQTDLDREAAQLSRQTGLARAACKFWMQERGLTTTLQLKDRYPGKSYAECYTLAAGEIEQFILA